MYYLRKEPYEQIISEIYKTDGTIIPERKYMTEDRAVYKHARFSRFYRQTYGKTDTELRLYKVKTLATILNQREAMHEYCGEWFDVYDENGKIDISKTMKCINGMLIEKCDGDGFFIPNKYFTVKDGSYWSIDESKDRIVGGEVRLENEKHQWIEISKEHFEENFQKLGV